MDDLISRKEAIESIKPIRYSGDFISTLIHLPAVDAMPVIHGHWKDNDDGTVSCNCCGTWFPKTRKSQLLFCGHCGAKMDE